MGALAAAPGVIGTAMITYVTSMDVMYLLGCKENKSYEVIRELNKTAKEREMLPYGRGKASKYIFSEKFGIPIDVVDAVIELNNKKEASYEEQGGIITAACETLCKDT